MVIPALVWMVLINIVPMFGIIMAFQDFNPGKGIFRSKFIGLENFEYMFQLKDVSQIFTNTIVIAVGKLLLNMVLSAFGMEPIAFFRISKLFRILAIGTDVWKEFGFNAVVYLAALTGISPSLYEAAAIDGAGRWSRMWHITLPGLKPVIVLMTILALGNILNAGFDQIYNIYNQAVYSTGDIIDTWVYRVGLNDLQFSLATAVGLLKSVIGFLMISLSYLIAYKKANYRIF